MAFVTKLFDVRCPDYSVRKVVLAAARTAGEFATLNSVNGFFFTGGAIGDTRGFVTKSRLTAVAKVSAQAWAVGTPVYWDATASNATTVATANTLIGTVAEAAAAADTEGIIDFDGTLAYAKA